MKFQLLLITALLILPASGAINVAYDAVCNGPGCMADIESEAVDRGQTRILSSGPIAASQAIVWSTEEYNSTTLIDADKGGFRVKMPNIRLRADMADLKVSSNLLYSTAFYPGEPEVYEDGEGNSWVSVENRTLHKEQARFAISGNGSLHEEIIIAAAGKSRKALDYNMTGNQSFNQLLSFSGQELKTSFSLMPEDGTVSTAEAEEIVRRGLNEVMR
jgi:hypothetical protein